MKCVICRSDNIRTQQVYEEFYRGDDIVRLPLEVPVCAHCGERYYDRPTMRHIEALRDKIRAGQVPLKETGKVLICQG